VDLLKRNKFCSFLKRFDENRIDAPLEQIDEDFPGVFPLPGKLQFLTICSRTFSKQILFPQSLKNLQLDIRDFSIVK